MSTPREDEHPVDDLVITIGEIMNAPGRGLQSYTISTLRELIAWAAANGGVPELTERCERELHLRRMTAPAPPARCHNCPDTVRRPQPDERWWGDCDWVHVETRMPECRVTLYAAPEGPAAA
jgi:hypothetical protein